MNKALEAPNDSLSAVSNTPPRHDSFNEKHERYIILYHA